MKTSKAQQFIILPPRGLSAAGATAHAVRNFFTTLESVRHLPAAAGRASLRATVSAPAARMRVVDSIHEDGPKLVEMDTNTMAALRAAEPGVRIVPIVYYHPARAPRAEIATKVRTARTGRAAGISITVVSAHGAAPVPGVNVVAFTDFDAREGAQGQTNQQGRATLALGGATKRVERLYLYAEEGFWSGLLKNVTLSSGFQATLQPIALPFTDAVRHFYGDELIAAGIGVKVGVIDTGVGPHDDLSVEGGVNTVTGEEPGNWKDNGSGHGTHVAGIIAGQNPSLIGVAPGVTLRSYRVFGKGADGATNFAISKAIDRAVADGCDLINMSLGGGDPDEATHSAIVDARAKGVLVFVATGNDDRAPVSFPASDSMALAVTALGRKGLFPAGTTQAADVVAPYGTDRSNFIAAFSNVGPEVDLTGPGLGIISTFPGNKLAVMDGTSMACPAATGAAARLLAQLPNVLGMARDQARSDAMAGAVLRAAATLGLPAELQGSGMIR